jgi:hypothetical protein
MIFSRSSLALVVATLLIATVSSGCGFLGIRSNPRVSKITSESETSRSSTSFDYDDDGRVVEVESDFQLLELVWDDGILTEVVRSDPEDEDSDEVTSELEYDNGRLVEMKADLGSSDDVTTIDYDKLGRIEKVEREQLDGDFVQTSLYEYDDEGRVAQIVTKSAFDSSDGLERSESKTEIEYEDGHVVTVTMSSDSGEFELEMEYEDGRLAKMDARSTFESTSTGEEIESEGTIEYEYDDDGLIVGAEIDSDGSESTLEVDYDDGEAIDLDVTPTNSMFFIPLFDLRGNTYSSFDVRTQTPRLAGVSW